jgi:hypothetical protein
LKYLFVFLLLFAFKLIFAETINSYTVWGTSGITDNFYATGNLIINDTLIIYGNLFLSVGEDLTVANNAVLIVIGDFDAKNKVDLGLGGTLIVTGNFDKNGSQGDILDSGGDMFLFDDTPMWGNGSGTITVDYGDEEDIINDPIFDFFVEIYNAPCALSLSASITDESALSANDGAIDVTVSGGVSPSFLWSNGATTEDISGLTESDFSLTVTEGFCVIDTTFFVGGNCCGTSGYYSNDNIVGNWEDVSSWASSNDSWRPLTPPTDGSSTGSTQPLCINGTISLNGDLTIRSTSHTICDTLIITGNLDVGSFSLTVGPNGVLIVLGNYTGTNGTTENTGKVIIAGEVDETYTLGGTGDTYIFDPTPTGNFKGDFTNSGDESDLAINDPDLYDFYQSVAVSCTAPTATITALDDTICNGDNVTLTITFTAGTAPFDITIETLGETGSSSTEVLSGITVNPYSYTPATAPVWINDATPDTDYTYSIAEITDANACGNTNQGSVPITVIKIPETGPQNHIHNAWGN